MEAGGKQSDSLREHYNQPRPGLLVGPTGALVQQEATSCCSDSSQELARLPEVIQRKHIILSSHDAMAQLDSIITRGVALLSYL